MATKASNKSRSNTINQRNEITPAEIVIDENFAVDPVEVFDELETMKQKADSALQDIAATNNIDLYSIGQNTYTYIWAIVGPALARANKYLYIPNTNRYNMEHIYIIYNIYKLLSLKYNKPIKLYNFCTAFNINRSLIYNEHIKNNIIPDIGITLYNYIKCDELETADNILISTPYGLSMYMNSRFNYDRKGIINTDIYNTPVDTTISLESIENRYMALPEGDNLENGTQPTQDIVFLPENE